MHYPIRQPPGCPVAGILPGQVARAVEAALAGEVQRETLQLVGRTVAGIGAVLVLLALVKEIGKENYLAEQM